MALGRKKKKELITLCCLLVIAGLLVAGYAFLTKRDEEAAKKEAEQLAAESEVIDQSVEICPLNKSEITAFSIKNPDYSASFSLVDGTWVCDGNSDFPVNQEIAKRLSSYLCSKATRLVTTEPVSMAEYGLEDANIEITASDSNGTKHALSLGTRCLTTDGFFARVGGNNNIYVVPNLMNIYFSYGERDFIAMDAAPAINTYYVRELSISGQRFEPLRLTYYDDPVDLYAGRALYNWTITEPFSEEQWANYDIVGELVKNYALISFLEAVDYRKETRSQYGLEEPLDTIRISYYEDETAANTNTLLGLKEFSLYVGLQNENGDYYVRPSNSENVYLMDEDAVSLLVTFDRFELLNKFMNLIDITTVSKVYATYGTTSRELPVVDDSTFRAVYQEIIGSRAAGLLPEDAVVGETPVLTVRYERTEEKYPEVLVTYLPYNDSYYAVRTNDKIRFYVDRRDVEALITTIEQYTP